ncbi:hypothetical protein MCEMRE182_00048 [Candidatus Nanopelagicaceae bacterium]
MVKPRLAVLISGSFRNFNETWPINRACLNDLGIEYDVFFHTWEDNPSLDIDVLDNIFNNRFYFSLQMKKFKPFIEVLNHQYIAREYNFHFIQVEKFDEHKIAQEFNLGNSKDNILYRSQLNSCGMYLGIDAVYQKIKYNETYTNFLRLRTDFLLDAGSLSQLFKHDLVFYGQLLPTAEGPIGDQCYGGRIEKSEFILNTLEQLKLVTSDETWNMTYPVVLAENIVRKKLAPLRSSIDILYLEGKGAIARPKLEQIENSFNFANFRRVLAHNRKVVLVKLSKFLTSKLKRIV